jgi:hypothetical protein
MTGAMLGVAFVMVGVGCATTVEEAPGKQQAAIAGNACDTEGATAACGPNDDGDLTCEKTQKGLVWSSCVVGPKTQNECALGQSQACTVKVPDGPNGSTIDEPGTQSCEEASGGQLIWGACVVSSGSTPLVLSFDGAHASYSTAPGVFDLAPEMSVATDWVTAATPWLALDRDHDGVIADGGELFGSATALSSGGHARNGFEALAELDANHDGRIDARDPAYASLSVWTDANQNRVSDPGELRTLASFGVASIDLGYANASHCDDRGNCEVESSRFTFVGEGGVSRTGRIVDVHLAHR